MLLALLTFPEGMLLEYSWGNADVLETGLGKESRAWVFICVRYQMPKASFSTSEGTPEGVYFAGGRKISGCQAGDGEVKHAVWLGKPTSRITTQCVACGRGKDRELWEGTEGTPQFPRREGFLEE